MSKILDAQDILTEVRDFIECIGMAAAASHLTREFGAPIVAWQMRPARKSTRQSNCSPNVGEPMTRRFRPRRPPSRCHHRRERRGGTHDKQGNNSARICNGRH
jgi:hypothetical protein